MADPSDKFKINLNQNLWGLVVSYGSLGAAEHWHLELLCWLSLVLASAMTISMLFTTLAYTKHYWKKKDQV